MSKSKKFVNRWTIQFRPIDEISMIAPSIKSLTEYSNPIMDKLKEDPDSMLSYAVHQISDKYGAGSVAYYMIQNSVIDSIRAIPGISVYQYRVESGSKFTVKSSMPADVSCIEDKLLDGYGEDWTRLAKVDSF